MVADGMTKALPKEKHLDLLTKMGVGEIVERITPPLSEEEETAVSSEA